VLSAVPAAFGETAAEIFGPREPRATPETLVRRQRPPCFDGSRTVRRFRPFLRRRDSTARPQRVAMRARNPCLLMRRLLRGRYDGFMATGLFNEPENLVAQGAMRQG
jgi:hypothetical protein